VASKKVQDDQTEAPYAYFLSDGTAYIAGAPPRNLTRAEWDALTRSVQDLCLATELYKLASPEPAEEVIDGR